jgi:hypothetical protein
MKEAQLKAAIRAAAAALLRGDWVGYQRVLRSLPVGQETEFLKQVDQILQSSKAAQRR